MDYNSKYIDYFYFLVPIIVNSAIWIKIKIKGLDNEDSIHYNTSYRNKLLSNAMHRLKKKKIQNQIPSHKLSFYSHQVAGHTDEALRGYRGKVLKPCRLSLSKRLLFMRELAVYEEMYTFGRHNVQSLIPFTPPYHGALEAFSTNSSTLKSSTTILEAKTQISNNKKGKNDYIKIDQIIEEEKKLNPNLVIKTIPYIILDDLCSSYKNPCIIDIKMGTQTFEPTASISKKERELLKYKYQSEMGFRIAGFQVYDIISKTNRKINKTFGRSILPHQVSEALSLFFFNGIHYRRDIIILTIQKLEKLLLWMRSQTNLHFYCSSILIIYDGNENISNSNGNNCNNNTEFKERKEDKFEKEADMDGYHFMNCIKDLPNTPPKKNIIRARNIERMIPLDISLHHNSQINDSVKIYMIDFAHSCKQPINDHNNDKIDFNLSKKHTDMKTSNPTPCIVDEGYIHGLEVIFLYI
jgi:hypothetical protein